MEAVERLQRVAGLMWTAVEERFDITDAQASVLEAIAGGARQVSSVADRCGRHISSASRVVDGLVSRGLVSRVPDPDDRRAVRLSLTPEGDAVAERVRAAQAEVLRRSLEVLDPEDASRFVDLMLRFARAAEDVVTDVDLS